MMKMWIAHRVEDYGFRKIKYDADTDRGASEGFSEGPLPQRSRSQHFFDHLELRAGE